MSSPHPLLLLLLLRLHPTILSTAILASLPRLTHASQQFLEAAAITAPHVTAHQPPLSPATYHPTGDLLAILRHQATVCPHAHAQWLTLRHTALSAILSSPPAGRLLTITLSHNAKIRASLSRARRATAPRTLVIAVFGEHPRERVTTELALSILSRYCHDAPRWAELVLVPIVNVDGRRLVDAGRSCQRLNPRNVDLNRNYQYAWGRSDAANLPDEERPGHHPLSEFETAALDALVRDLRPAAYLSVHSGDNAVLVPWDSADAVGGAVARVARVVRDKHCPHCHTGSARDLFGYHAYGSGVDHMYGIRNVPFAITLEIYGRSHPDCATMFNPESAEVLAQVLSNWSGVLETVAREIQTAKPVQAKWFPHIYVVPKGYHMRMVEDGMDANNGANHDFRDIAAPEAIALIALFVAAVMSVGWVLLRKHWRKRLVRRAITAVQVRGSSLPSFKIGRKR